MPLVTHYVCCVTQGYLFIGLFKFLTPFAVSVQSHASSI